MLSLVPTRYPPPYWGASVNRRKRPPRTSSTEGSSSTETGTGANAVLPRHFAGHTVEKS